MFLKLAVALICCQFSVEVVPSFTVDVNPPAQPELVVEVPKQSRRYLAMFTATYCQPCQVWKRNTKPQIEAAGHHVQLVEMTNPENARKYGKRINRFPSFVVVDWDTGTWLSEPQVGGMDLATATWMLDGPGISLSDIQPAKQVVTPSPQSPPVRSAPNRYIQWPGWGQIDLETYNRNCNCNMCISIRAQQQEYRRQLEAFQRPQSQVTPDQEGTPHALVEEMLDNLGLLPSDTLGDLGCGDGRILIAAAKRGIRGIGIELDPARSEVARHNVKVAGVEHLVTIETGDALEFDLNRVTAVTAYLYPPLLTKLSPRLKSLRVVASPYHEIPGLPMANQGDFWIYRQ